MPSQSTQTMTVSAKTGFGNGNTHRQPVRQAQSLQADRCRSVSAII